jgi:hypothetical protein
MLCSLVMPLIRPFSPLSDMSGAEDPCAHGGPPRPRASLIEINGFMNIL